METKKIKNIPWKLSMRCAFISGEKIKPKNEEESNYLDLLKAKKAKYDAKIAELNKKQKERIDDIKVNADMLTERILESLIQKEETDKKLKKAEDSAKAKAKDKTVKKAEDKKARKKEYVINKTIPNQAAIANAKKQQDFLSKAHAAKREDIEKRLAEKIEAFQKKKEEREAKREERKQKMMKRATAKVHHKDISLTRTTKEQRTQEIKDKKLSGEEEYKKMIAMHQKEAHKPEVITKREEKAKKEAERQQRIAEHRIERKKKLMAVELSQKKKTESDIKRFLSSEKARLARKETKRAKYSISSKEANNENKEYMITLFYKDDKQSKLSNTRHTKEELHDRLQKIRNYQVGKNNGFLKVEAYEISNPKTVVDSVAA